MQTSAVRYLPWNIVITCRFKFAKEKFLGPQMVPQVAALFFILHIFI